MSDRSILLIFMKSPVKGRVKSRLAAAVGEKAALELYKNLILDTIDTAKGCGYPFRICFYPPDAEETISSWIGREFPIMPQTGGDLGSRMKNAFERIFSEGFTSAALIGSDLPELPAAAIREAFEALATNDAVIGPAEDGGYYLIGFNRAALLPHAFRGIAWGTKTVFRQTMDALRSASLRVHELPPWADMDTIEDLKTLLLRYEGGGPAASRTAAYLKTLRGVTL